MTEPTTEQRTLSLVARNAPGIWPALRIAHDLGNRSLARDIFDDLVSYIQRDRPLFRATEVDLEGAIQAAWNLCAAETEL